MLAKKDENKYTFEDYLMWDDGKRWELYDGHPVLMSPAPRPEHQLLLGALYKEFANYLDKKPCQVFLSPFDVRPYEKPGGSEPKKVNTVLQPDLSVVCDKKQIDKRGCKGGPALVVEILSKSTSRRDIVVKRKIYEKAGVKEYWIAKIEEASISKYVLENGIFKYPEVFFPGDIMESDIIKGLKINITDIFTVTDEGLPKRLRLKEYSPPFHVDDNGEIINNNNQ
jgi:Uma2 family endonuclease